MDNLMDRREPRIGVAPALHPPQLARPRWRAQAKRLIVRLALRGVIPPWLATWLIQRGGLRHE